jgi:hypothetical protein
LKEANKYSIHTALCYCVCIDTHTYQIICMCTCCCYCCFCFSNLMLFWKLVVYFFIFLLNLIFHVFHPSIMVDFSFSLNFLMFSCFIFSCSSLYIFNPLQKIDFCPLLLFWCCMWYVVFVWLSCINVVYVLPYFSCINLWKHYLVLLIMLCINTSDLYLIFSLIESQFNFFSMSTLHSMCVPVTF